MFRRTVSTIMLTLILTSVLPLAFNIQPVGANGTIYIRADGSIDPPTAPLSTIDNVTYTFTDKINDSIVVERSNIVVDGNGYTLQGSETGIGIFLFGRENVMVRNTLIKGFEDGILLDSSFNNSISGNNITDSGIGILICQYSSNNSISGNNVANGRRGIDIEWFCNYNSISGNNIAANNVSGISFFDSSSNNCIYHNYLTNNTVQACSSTLTNIWDGGYPSGGNYWSDYSGIDVFSGPFQNETGSDDIGDTPYIVDSSNFDRYPLMGSLSENVSDLGIMKIATGAWISTLDPARCYDTSNVELLLNVYEPLIFFDRERISQFVPRVATSWSITPDGLTYIFTIRQGVKFHNNETLTTEDVEYSLERLLVIEGDPAWMFYEAFFDTYGSHDVNGSFVIDAQQLDSAITRTDTTVTLHLAKPYPPLMQALSAVWASILCKEWCLELGDWPGSWNNWTSYNKPFLTAIELQDTRPPGPRLNAASGTGPFVLDYYFPGVQWSIFKSENYWGGWPAPGCNDFLQRVTCKIIGNYETRKSMFLDGSLDSISVPRTEIGGILGQPGIRSIYPLPTLDCFGLLFTFNMSLSSPYLGVLGGLPSQEFDESGIPPDIFGDIYFRKSFAYTINYSGLINDVLLGEGYQPPTPIIPGLPFYNMGQEKYQLNLSKSEELLRAAWGGKVWENGFNMSICYNGFARQRVCEMIKSGIEGLNPRFHINLRALTLGEYYASMEAHELALFMVGWAADFADPHNFACNFMYSGGLLTRYQRYGDETIDALVRNGIATMDYSERKSIYYELQRLYYEDCPGVTLYETRGRRFEREQVKGWYYNPLLFGADYFYVQWKEDDAPYGLNAGENVIDALSRSDTKVFINTTSPGNLTITATDVNLEGTITEGIEVHYVKCVTIDTSVPKENISFPIEVRVYYTDQEVISAYVSQSTLHMYYWNGTNWLLENNTGVVAPSDIVGYAGYVWAKIDHLSLFSSFGQISAPDVAVTHVSLAKTLVGQGYLLSSNVTIENKGDPAQIPYVAIYANGTMVAATSTLILGWSASISTVLSWNTTGFLRGNYSLVVFAYPAPGEAEIADNNHTCPISVHVGVPGDISGQTQGVYDQTVNMRDVQYLILRFNTNPSSSNWNPNADINDDGTVNMRDIQIAILNFNKHE